MPSPQLMTILLNILCFLAVHLSASYTARGLAKKVLATAAVVRAELPNVTPTATP